MPQRTTGIMRTIPASNQIVLRNDTKKKRVAGYARVSTGSDEQQTSYKSQIDYYTSLIKRNTKWEFVGLYSDEGISGTNTKKRDGFKKMIIDATDGKIDLIITKSISRFARNTVDSLSTIRKLKECGVEVYFEKENIKTFDQSGELLLSILSSLSQEESRSISTNVQWGIRRRFADGYVRMRFNNFLGYEKGKDGKARIIEKDAKVIKLIYKLFLQGYGYRTIAKKLMELNIKSPGGKDTWRDHTVKSILTNERYMGDALLQKTFTVDFLNKKSKKNEGEIPQYYIENDHDAIINKNTFNAVQDEIRKREIIGSDSIANKVICGECGGRFGKKVWHSNDKYRKEVYQCNDKFKKHCDNVTISEEEIKGYFLKAINQILDNKDEIIKNIEMASKRLNVDDLIKQRDDITDELNKVIVEINNMVYKSATGNEDNNNKYQKYDKLKEKLDLINVKIKSQIEREGKLKVYIDNLKKAKIVDKFLIEQWGLFLDKMIIYKNKVVVRFNDETEIVL